MTSPGKDIEPYVYRGSVPRGTFITSVLEVCLGPGHSPEARNLGHQYLEDAAEAINPAVSPEALAAARAVIAEWDALDAALADPYAPMPDFFNDEIA